MHVAMMSFDWRQQGREVAAGASAEIREAADVFRDFSEGDATALLRSVCREWLAMVRWAASKARPGSAQEVESEALAELRAGWMEKVAEILSEGRGS